MVDRYNFKSADEYIDFLEDRREELEAENKALREGLEVYANPENWLESDRNCDKSVLNIAEYDCNDDFNGFEIAQKALNKL